MHCHLSDMASKNEDETQQHISIREACLNSDVFIDDIKCASQRLSDYAQQTPVFTSSSMNTWLNVSDGCVKHFFKAECFQKTGSFKFRGATNFIKSSTDEGDVRPLITHSSGNHGQAVAAAAALFGRDAHIVVPCTAPETKLVAIKSYGGHIVPCAPDMHEREKTAHELCERIDGVIVHSSADRLVLAGQGTVGLEFLTQVKDLDAIIVSVAGGGLISGIAIAAKSHNPSIHIVGVEPLISNSARRSLDAGRRVSVPYNVNTIADALKASVSSKGWEVIKRLVSTVVCVSELEIAIATQMVWERMKLVIEPAAGAAVAAARTEEFRKLKCQRVGIVLCGGNVNLNILPWNTENSQKTT